MTFNTESSCTCDDCDDVAYRGGRLLLLLLLSPPPADAALGEEVLGVRLCCCCLLLFLLLLPFRFFREEEDADVALFTLRIFFIRLSSILVSPSVDELRS